MKRATDEKTQIPYIVYISIHALVKRATYEEAEKWLDIEISIHALVKRATSAEDFYSRAVFYFNPRPREEGDRFKW